MFFLKAGEPFSPHPQCQCQKLQIVGVKVESKNNLQQDKLRGDLQAFLPVGYRTLSEFLKLEIGNGFEIEGVCKFLLKSE